jgi:hypothetical protein
MTIPADEKVIQAVAAERRACAKIARETAAWWRLKHESTGGTGVGVYHASLLDLARAEVAEEIAETIEGQ